MFIFIARDNQPVVCYWLTYVNKLSAVQTADEENAHVEATLVTRLTSILTEELHNHFPHQCVCQEVIHKKLRVL